MSGLLDRTPSAVVRQLLVNLGLGTDPDTNGAWPVFAVSQPDTPDASICVNDPEGKIEGRTQIDGETQEFYGIQVAIRTSDPQVGAAKAFSIANDLDTRVLRTDVTLGSNTYRIQSINRTGGVISAGVEKTSRRRLFTINALMSMRQLTGTGTGTA